MKFYFVALLFYVFSFGFYYWGYQNKKQFNFPSKNLYKVYGLDLSHHQQDVDWEKLSYEDYKFVYLKATEGESFKDPRFQENYKRAKKNGFAVGGYHFFSACVDVSLQFENLISVVPKAKGDLLPVLDVESVKGCSLSDAELSNRVLNMVQRLKEHYGAKPVLYTTREFAGSYPSVLNFKNHYWLRSLVGPPVWSKTDWILWQYYNAGKVEGIKGPVDLNVLKTEHSLSLLLQN